MKETLVGDFGGRLGRATWMKEICISDCMGDLESDYMGDFLVGDLYERMLQRCLLQSVSIE